MAVVRVRVTGRVQGVGFRGFVLRLAQQYGVVGEVWNGADGAVGAILQSGDPATLDRMVTLLRTGPGHVDKVESFPTEEGNYEEFAITFSRFNS